MEAEWRSKTENPVEYGRPSENAMSGLRPTSVIRWRQPHMAKEPLCGTQPANLSLVIAVFTFSVLFRYFCLHSLESKEQGGRYRK